MAINPEEVTIIVPTRNEERNIRKFLDSLPESVNLIVVDAGDDGTADIVSSARPHYTKVIRDPGTVAEARKIGADNAATPWLLFTDADVVFHDDYFINLARFEQYDLIYGPKLSLDFYKTYYKWFAYGQYLIHLLGVPAASGSNCLVRKKAYLESGGFDLRLTCNEDSEFAWRVKQTGYKAAYAFDLVVYAGDHRRLDRGMIKKTLHSITRCTALYLDIIPDKWRSYDWGYWSGYNTNRELRDGN